MNRVAWSFVLAGCFVSSAIAAPTKCVVARGLDGMTLNWGSVQIGSDSIKSLKLVNRCRAEQSVTFSVATGDFAASVAGKTVVLPGRVRTSIPLHFLPTVAGARKADFSIVTKRLAIVTLAGVGVLLSPSPIDTAKVVDSMSTAVLDSAGSAALDSATVTDGGSVLPEEQALPEVSIDSLVVMDVSGAPVTIRSAFHANIPPAGVVRRFDLLGRRMPLLVW